ncbi:protein of unknown function (plasmid) [Beijerinckiaceae bacterium RH AL1]|nr:protein of unknown function [Beijerinckiaceae bacterium RH AL1]
MKLLTYPQPRLRWERSKRLSGVLRLGYYVQVDTPFGDNPLNTRRLVCFPSSERP